MHLKMLAFLVRVFASYSVLFRGFHVPLGDSRDSGLRISPTPHHAAPSSTTKSYVTPSGRGRDDEPEAHTTIHTLHTDHVQVSTLRDDSPSSYVDTLASR